MQLSRQDSCFPVTKPRPLLLAWQVPAYCTDLTSLIPANQFNCIVSSCRETNSRIYCNQENEVTDVMENSGSKYNGDRKARDLVNRGKQTCQQGC